MPQATGFQDYNKLAIQAASILYQDVHTLATWPTSPRLDAAGFGFINVNFSGGVPQSDQFRFQLIWFTDAAMTILANTVDITLFGAGQTFQFPVIGRWFTVFPILFNGAGTSPMTVTVFGSNVQTNRFVSQSSGQPYIAVSQSIAANTTVNFDGLFTVPGRAVWTVAASTNITWLAALSYYDLGSSSYIEFTLMYGAQFGQAANTAVILPATPIRMIVNNSSAVAQVFSCALCPDPW